MKFMVLVKANADSEAGVMPSESEIVEMGQFNEELVKAGILLAADGLQASSKGARITIGPDGKRTVLDGPFTETKELIAGFAIVQVKSKAEAIELAERFLKLAGEGESEIRLMHDTPAFVR